MTCPEKRQQVCGCCAQVVLAYWHPGYYPAVAQAEALLADYDAAVPRG